MEKRVFLKSKFKEQLANTPETGMGYHIVDIELLGGIILKNKIILNCKILLLDKNEEPYINSNQINKILTQSS